MEPLNISRKRAIEILREHYADYFDSLHNPDFKPSEALKLEIVENMAVCKTALDWIEKAEAGLLAELPAPVGSIVYTYYQFDDIDGEKVEGVDEHILRGLITDSGGNKLCVLECKGGDFIECPPESVFLSRQEAEAKIIYIPEVSILQRV